MCQFHLLVSIVFATFLFWAHLFPNHPAATVISIQSLSQIRKYCRYLQFSWDIRHGTSELTYQPNLLLFPGVKDDSFKIIPRQIAGISHGQFVSAQMYIRFVRYIVFLMKQYVLEQQRRLAVATIHTTARFWN